MLKQESKASTSEKHYAMEKALDSSEDNELEEVKSIIKGYNIKKIKENKAEIKFWISIPVGVDSFEDYVYCDTVKYNDSNKLRNLFESNGTLENPIGKTVKAKKNKHSEWTVFGKTIKSASDDKNRNYLKHSERKMDKYRNCVLEESKEKSGYGKIVDYYVINSEPHIEQDYAIGLFIELPNGKIKTFEDIHDKDCPSEVLESIIDFDKSLTSQIGNKVPLWYNGGQCRWKKSEWKITKRDYNNKSNRVINAIMTTVFGQNMNKPDELFGFGRNYGTESNNKPLPSCIEEVPEDRIPNLETEDQT